MLTTRRSDVIAETTVRLVMPCYVKAEEEKRQTSAYGTVN